MAVQPSLIVNHTLNHTQSIYAKKLVTIIDYVILIKPLYFYCWLNTTSKNFYFLSVGPGDVGGFENRPPGNAAD